METDFVTKSVIDAKLVVSHRNHSFAPKLSPNGFPKYYCKFHSRNCKDPNCLPRCGNFLFPINFLTLFNFRIDFRSGGARRSGVRGIRSGCVFRTAEHFRISALISALISEFRTESRRTRQILPKSQCDRCIAKSLKFRNFASFAASFFAAARPARPGTPFHAKGGNFALKL